MSFWGGKNIYAVAASITPLIKVKQDIVAQAIQDGVRNQTSIITNLLNLNVSGIFGSINNYFMYGKNQYVNGLPVILRQFTTVNPLDMETLLTTLLSTPTTVTRAFLGAANPDFLAKAILTQPPYNMDLTTLGVHNTKLDGNNPVTYVSSNFTSNELVCKFTWGTGTIAYVHYGIPELKTNPYNLCYLVRYKTQADTANAVPDNLSRYWYYFPDTHVYPSLDISAVHIVEPEYLPIAPITINKKRVTTDKALKKEVHNLLATLKIDLDYIDKAVYNIANPNISNLDDSFIAFAVDIASQEPASIKYLATYFKNMALNSLTDITTFNSAVNNYWFSKEDLPYNIIKIEDGEYKVYLQYNYITTTTSTGSIATPTSVVTTQLVDPTLIEYGGDVIQRSYITYRYQSSLNQITTIQVHGLFHITTIYKNKAVIRYLEDTTTITYDKGFYMPVSFTISKTMSGKDQSLLYYDSLVFVAYAIQKTHLAWYQTPEFLGLFGFVMTVIGIVSTLLSFGTSSSFSNALKELLKSYIKVFAFTEAAKFLLSSLGINSLILIEIIALVEYAKMSKSDTLFNGLLNTEDLLLLTNSIPETITVVSNDSLKTIETTLSTAVTEYDKEMKKINDVMKQFEQHTTISLLTDNAESTSLSRFDSESPDSFYFRTIHATNIGVIALDSISNYTDNQLKLSLHEDTTNG